MKFYVDAQLPPGLAPWLASTFGVEAKNLDAMGLRHADDLEIFRALSNPGDVVITKDEDFLDLIVRFGAPPQVVWVTCGNTTNRVLRSIFERGFSTVSSMIETGEPIVQLDHRG